jgi:4-hydroxybenzoate polyprenyltransferase
MSPSREVRGPVVFDQIHLPILLIPVGPFFIGWVLASGRLLPDTYEFWLALVSVLPFLGLGTVFVNDAYDVSVDALSRRKGTYASSKGQMSPGSLKGMALGAFTASGVLAGLVSYQFLLVILVLVGLALLYSVPPVQLSRRPGLDLLANSLGIGVICTIGGWLVGSPDSLPPMAWLFVSALGTGTFFLLPTLMDYKSDTVGGKRTVAVVLGWRNTCYLGMALIGLADVGIVYMSLASVILKPSFLWIAWVIILGELLVFPLLASKAHLLKQLTAAMGLLLFVGNLLIVLSFLDALGPF